MFGLSELEILHFRVVDAELVAGLFEDRHLGVRQQIVVGVVQ